MNNKVIVITREGNQISLEQWQEIYGLPVGSNRIGKFFYLSEWRFQEDIRLYGELVVNELLIRLLDAVRKASNHPIVLNSFNRSESKQEELRGSGARAATTSPHVVIKELGKVKEHDKRYGATAGDVDTLSKDDTIALAKRVREVSEIVNIKCRIGYKQYLEDGNTFVHVDVCPEYYAPGKPWHDRPHPPVWELTNTW